MNHPAEPAAAQPRIYTTELYKCSMSGETSCRHGIKEA